MHGSFLQPVISLRMSPITLTWKANERDPSFNKGNDLPPQNGNIYLFLSSPRRSHHLFLTFSSSELDSYSNTDPRGCRGVTSQWEGLIAEACFI